MLTPVQKVEEVAQPIQGLTMKEIDLMFGRDSGNEGGIQVTLDPPEDSDGEPPASPTPISMQGKNKRKQNKGKQDNGKRDKGKKNLKEREGRSEAEQSKRAKADDSGRTLWDFDESEGELEVDNIDAEGDVAIVLDKEFENEVRKFMLEVTPEPTIANILEERMNDSRHAPAAQKTTQRKAADEVITRIAEDMEQREEAEQSGEANDVEMGREEGEGSRSSIWDTILGGSEWRDCESTLDVGAWHVTMKQMVTDVKAIKEGRVGGGQMLPTQKKRLWAKCQEVVAGMVEMMVMMADSELDTDWQEVEKREKAAILEWLCMRKDTKDNDLRKDILEPMAQSICFVAAKEGMVGPRGKRLAEAGRKAIEEEIRADNRNRMNNKGISIIQQDKRRIEKERQEEERGIQKARAEEEANLTRLEGLKEKSKKIMRELVGSEEGAREKALRSELEMNEREIQACESSGTDFTSPTMQWQDGVVFKTGRMISVHSSLEVEKKGEEQREQMKIKMNDLLKSVKCRDGATPFAVITKVVEERGWNGEEEITWVLTRVNEREMPICIQDVMKD